MGSAHTLKLPLLEDSQDLGLEGDIQIGNLIEIERAAISQLEIAFFGSDGPGKGTFYMAEKLTFNKRLRQTGTVGRDHRACRTAAPGVDQPGHHFLSKLQFGVRLANPDGTDLDLQRLLRKAPDQFDLPVRMGQTLCRLVGRRLPDDVVNRRIRKANEASQSKSRQISDLYRLFLHYALFVTSLPAEFGMVQLFALYRIRWQVELAF